MAKDSGPAEQRASMAPLANDSVLRRRPTPLFAFLALVRMARRGAAGARDDREAAGKPERGRARLSTAGSAGRGRAGRLCASTERGDGGRPFERNAAKPRGAAILKSSNSTPTPSTSSPPWPIDQLNHLLGRPLPHALQVVIIWVLIIAAILSGLLTVWGFIRGITHMLSQKVFPHVFYTKGQKRRLRQRHNFARHLLIELNRLNDLEDWRETRYAELQAEVEVEARPRWRLPFLTRPRADQFRLERSLTRAIRRSADQIILLQGAPGSGKSVALRFLAQTLTAKALRSKRLDAVIPLYVNLKEVPSRGDASVDGETINAFVLDSLNKANAGDVNRFLDQEFERGKQDGTWLFLLDSFDEIPDILAATEVNEAIQLYTAAIYGFMARLGGSRGVIASRDFRGPRIHRRELGILRLCHSRIGASGS